MAFPVLAFVRKYKKQIAFTLAVNLLNGGGLPKNDKEPKFPQARVQDVEPHVQDAEAQRKYAEAQRKYAEAVENFGDMLEFVAGPDGVRTNGDQGDDKRFSDVAGTDGVYNPLDEGDRDRLSFAKQKQYWDDLKIASGKESEDLKELINTVKELKETADAVIKKTSHVQRLENQEAKQGSVGIFK